jgi:hypothetical protein
MSLPHSRFETATDVTRRVRRGALSLVYRLGHRGGVPTTTVAVGDDIRERAVGIEATVERQRLWAETYPGVGGGVNA